MHELGDRQLGKYRLERPIGYGGMATVYLARDQDLNRPVAVKILDPALANEPGAVERFRREAVTAANLEHPNIMPVYDVAEAEGLHYFAMRYIPGETLRDLLERERRLSPARVLEILGPVAAALDYAHQRGVIHRDVKPGNILIEPNGHVVLTDFGIARAGWQQNLTRTGKVMGTAEYLAPEQIQGHEVTPAADIYSLGIVLYELLVGRTPFAGEHLAQTLYSQVHEPPPPLKTVAPDLPPGLQQVIERALQKNPALRYRRALELTTGLARFVPGGADAARWGAGTATAAALPPQREELSPELQRHLRGWTPTTGVPAGRVAGGVDRRLLLAGGLLLGLLMIVLAAIALRGRDETPADASGRPTATAGAIAAEETAPVELQTPPVVPDTPAPEEQPAFAPPPNPAYTGPRREGNGPNLHIGRANRPPEIDGDIGDWSGAQGFTPIKVVLNPDRWRGPDDLSAEFRIGYDDDNFYVSAVVTDDIHVQNRLTRRFDLWKGDYVELWFDFDLAGDFDRDPGDADDWQIGLSPGDFRGWPPQAVYFMPQQIGGGEKGVRVAARPRGESSYVLEAAIPWPVPEFRPRPGSAMGFCASVGDNDTPGTAEQEKHTSTCERLRWNLPTTFGMLYY